MNQKNLKLRLLNNMVWILAIVFFLAFSLSLGNVFFNFNNIHFIFYVASMLGLLVLAESVALISGNMDLSVAQNAGLSAMIGGMLIIKFGISGYLAIPLIMVVGGALGAINGYFIGIKRLNPFLVTLSTFLMFDWMTYVIRKTSILTLPDAYMFPGGGKIGGIYVAIFIFAVVTAVLFIFLRKTKFGNYVYAVGGNSKAADMLGINTGRVLFWVFTLSGALSGLAGLIYTGYAEAVTSTLADGEVFMAFGGAVIGGISMNGGRGNATNAVGGVILIGIIQAGLTMMMISPELQGFFTGLLVFVAILLNQFRETLRNKILMPS